MTAVEWLVQEANLLENNGWILPLIEQANELFEQQIKNAFNAGVNSEDFFCPPFEISESEKYYNETYKPST